MKKISVVPLEDRIKDIQEAQKRNDRGTGWVFLIFSVLLFVAFVVAFIHEQPTDDGTVILCLIVLPSVLWLVSLAIKKLRK